MSQPMMRQHNDLLQVVEGRHRATEDAHEASGVQPMDLTADEAWSSDPPSSPCPSFPSPTESPPQTHDNDWLGGSYIWQVGRKARETQSSTVLSTANIDFKPQHHLPAVQLTSGCASVPSDSTSATVRDFEVGDRSMLDTVDQLLAIDAASTASAAVDSVSVITLSVPQRCGSKSCP